jgi:hypothetical protein
MKAHEDKPTDEEAAVGRQVHRRTGMKRQCTQVTTARQRGHTARRAHSRRATKELAGSHP